VVDPLRAAREIERVLVPDGIVLVTMPFSFPWHGVPVDFFRATPSGLRALFRGCDVSYLAAGMGAGSALAYGIGSTPRLAGRPRWLRYAVTAGVRILVAPIKHLDRLEDPAARPALFAGECQLVGRRAEHTLTDREVLLDVRRRFG
jgi:SAM-dependent methyltransferase